MAENGVDVPLIGHRLHYRLNARISSSIAIPTAA
jgi:hypothetical protein